MVVSLAQSFKARKAKFPMISGRFGFCRRFEAVSLKLFEAVHVAQGKAQARSVQVTSEPSAVVPVEQKQEAMGKPWGSRTCHSH